MEFDMADAEVSKDMLSSIPETSLNTPVVTCANGYTKKVDEVTNAETGVVSEVVTCNVKACPVGPNDLTCSGAPACSTHSRTPRIYQPIKRPRMPPATITLLLSVPEHMSLHCALPTPPPCYNAKMWRKSFFHVQPGHRALKHVKMNLRPQ